jgi:hypothetical protein
MDPKAMMELSKLTQELPPAALSRLQTIMHNMMAGFDVKKELQDFEQSLPPGFREKVMGIVGATGMQNMMPPFGASASTSQTTPMSANLSSAPNTVTSVKDARMTILHAVAAGELTPDSAYATLFVDEPV